MKAREPLDARGDRAAQGVVGVLLLAGFVFRLPGLIPIVGLLLAGGAVLGPEADAFERLFAAVLVPRLGPGGALVPAETAQAQDIALALLCLVATLSFLAVTALGWLVAILAAVVAIVAAATGIHLGEWIVNRLFSR